MLITVMGSIFLRENHTIKQINESASPGTRGSACLESRSCVVILHGQDAQSLFREFPALWTSLCTWTPRHPRAWQPLLPCCQHGFSAKPLRKSRLGSPAHSAAQSAPCFPRKKWSLMFVFHEFYFHLWETQSVLTYGCQGRNTSGTGLLTGS